MTMRIAVTFDVEALKKEILAEFPSFSMVPKSVSWVMKAVNVLLVALSLGQTRTFMEDITTSLGTTVYTPSNWDSWPAAEQCEILRHERVHMRQARRYSRPVYSFLYLMGFFPIGLAYFRAKFEMEAYAETLAVLRERGVDLTNPMLKAAYVGFITGHTYLWAWPFKSYVERWYDTTVVELQSGKLLS